jgi:hypothetical protein
MCRRALIPSGPIACPATATTSRPSPNLDAIRSRQPPAFTQAVSAAQWTVPSHASMFTGLYPSEHTMVQSYSVLPKDLPTLAERLQASGYHTAGFCNNPLVGVINNGLRRGLTSFLNYSGLLTSKSQPGGYRPGLIGRYRQWFKRQIAGVLNRIQDAFARSDALLALSFTPLMVPLWQTALSFKGNTAKIPGRYGQPADQPQGVSRPTSRCLPL